MCTLRCDSPGSKCSPFLRSLRLYWRVSPVREYFSVTYMHSSHNQMNLIDSRPCSCTCEPLLCNALHMEHSLTRDVNTLMTYGHSCKQWPSHAHGQCTVNHVPAVPHLEPRHNAGCCKLDLAVIKIDLTALQKAHCLAQQAPDL